MGYGVLQYEFKADISNFNGIFKIQEPLDWLYRVEPFFHFIDIREYTQFKMVYINLTVVQQLGGKIIVKRVQMLKIHPLFLKENAIFNPTKVYPS